MLKGCTIETLFTYLSIMSFCKHVRAKGHCGPLNS